jgi:hypothetical protein
MNENNIFSRVPESVTFGYKILQIPTLQEMGITLGGLGLVSLHERLRSTGYEPCWINRGDPLLTYKFWFFRYHKKSLFSIFHDPQWHESFEIISPLSGLLLSTREEYTIDFLGTLQYEWCNERLLPIILVPNDEPPPDAQNFYIYDRIASHLNGYFDVIPIRDYSRMYVERLRGWIDRTGGDDAKLYLGRLSALQERNPDSYRAYKIRELTDQDVELVGMIQRLRSKDIHLREKLVHIARKYGESI